MAPPTTTAARPMAIAHPNSAPSGWLKGGRLGTASEKVPWPVHASNPMKISEPIPAATRPGTSTSPSIGPPSPDASITKKAPVSGEPRRVLTAAKLPEAPTTPMACAGASRLARRMAPAASPPPRAIRGASGPMTAPKARPARAASATPGS